MNYYRHHIGDYLRDTAHLSLVEDGAYRRLLDLYYMTESAIADNIPSICRRIRAHSDAEIRAVETVLNEFFVLVDGAWSQKRADHEIEVAQAAIERARTNGKAGGRPKKTAAVNHENPEETQPVISGLAKHNPEESSPSSILHPLVTNVTKVGRRAFDPIDSCPPEINPVAWSDWVSHRRSRRKAISESGARGQWKVLSSLTYEQQAACIESSIRNDYQGLFPEKFSHETNRPGSRAPEDRSAAGRVAANARRELAAIEATDHQVVGADGPYVRAQVVERVRG